MIRVSVPVRNLFLQFAGVGVNILVREFFPIL